MFPRNLPPGDVGVRLALRVDVREAVAGRRGPHCGVPRGAPGEPAGARVYVDRVVSLATRRRGVEGVEDPPSDCTGGCSKDQGRRRRRPALDLRPGELCAARGIHGGGRRRGLAASGAADVRRRLARLRHARHHPVRRHVLPRLGLQGLRHFLQHRPQGLRLQRVLRRRRPLRSLRRRLLARRRRRRRESCIFFRLTHRRRRPTRTHCRRGTPCCSSE
mmetsp:Transcript_9033/g.29299  ORF Transcript_9033/g.29299 Transcript_9033/m.29299 type:complete len:218 (+) Transcript_9033:173-826(+)